MYKFDKFPQEEIKYISDNALLKKEDNYVTISVVLTNKRLILLDYPSGVNNYEETLRVGRGADYLRKKEPILIINIEDIVDITDNKYTLKDSNYFYLKDDELKKNL